MMRLLSAPMLCASAAWVRTGPLASALRTT